MRIRGIDLELAIHGPAEFGLRQHPPDGILDYTFRMTLMQLTDWHFAEPTRISGVPTIHLLLPLVSREHDLVGVDHNDIIARIHVGRERWFVFAPKNLGDFACQSA